MATTAVATANLLVSGKFLFADVPRRCEILLVAVGEASIQCFAGGSARATPFFCGIRFEESTPRVASQTSYVFIFSLLADMLIDIFIILDALGTGTITTITTTRLA